MKGSNSSKNTKTDFSATCSLVGKSGSENVRLTYKDTLSFIIQLAFKTSKGNWETKEFRSDQLKEIGDKISLTVRKVAAGNTGENPVAVIRDTELTSTKSSAELEKANLLRNNLVPVSREPGPWCDTTITGSPLESFSKRGVKRKRTSSGSTDQLSPGSPPGSKSVLKKSRVTGSSQTTNGSTGTSRKRSLSSMISGLSLKDQCGQKLQRTSASSDTSHCKSKEKEDPANSTAGGSSSPQTKAQSSSWVDFKPPGKKTEKPSSQESIESLSSDEKIESSSSGSESSDSEDQDSKDYGTEAPWEIAADKEEFEAWVEENSGNFEKLPEETKMDYWKLWLDMNQWGWDSDTEKVEGDDESEFEDDSEIDESDFEMSDE